MDTRRTASARLPDDVGSPGGGSQGEEPALPQPAGAPQIDVTSADAAKALKVRGTGLRA